MNNRMCVRKGLPHDVASLVSTKLTALDLKQHFPAIQEPGLATRVTSMLLELGFDEWSDVMGQAGTHGSPADRLLLPFTYLCMLGMSSF